MKTVTALVGSPRQERSGTRRLVADFVELVARRFPEIETDYVTLGADAVAPCRGCFGCSATGVCQIGDDLAAIQAKLLAADLIVLASPVYVCHVSAQMKAFIDRSFVWAHALSLFGKPALTAVTAAFGDMRPAESYLTSIACAFGAIPLGGVRRYPYRPAETPDPATDALADRVAAVLSGRLAAVPTAANRDHFEMLKAVLPTIPGDYAKARWSSRGWFDQSFDQALAVAASPV